MTVTTLDTPPTAPGSLTAPPPPRTVLTYLDELRRWRDDLKTALGSLDRRAQVSSAPESFTGDLTLALSLSESIDRRTDELIQAWDSGRVGDKELARIAQLMWGRLPDPLGNPSAFSLSEATTLAAALEARLAARLDADTIAGSGAADRIGPLRETLARCHDLADTLGRRGGEAEALTERLETALRGAAGPAALGIEVGRIADAAELLERDLIKETSLRASVARESAALAARIAELAATEAQVRATAELCRDKIATPPRLAVPDIAALGPVPPIPGGTDGTDAPGTWKATQAALTDYRARLERAAAALAEADRRYAAPLAERAELRGLAEAYQAKAARAGLAEDPALGERFAAVRALLWRAPCDLAAAGPLVAEYGRAVQVAVGAVAVTEPAVPGLAPRASSATAPAAPPPPAPDASTPDPEPVASEEPQ
jgi:hypothetical protein